MYVITNNTDYARENTLLTSMESYAIVNGVKNSKHIMRIITDAYNTVLYTQYISHMHTHNK